MHKHHTGIRRGPRPVFLLLALSMEEHGAYTIHLLSDIILGNFSFYRLSEMTVFNSTDNGDMVYICISHVYLVALFL
jgi:hypothetical protein